MTAPPAAPKAVLTREEYERRLHALEAPDLWRDCFPAADSEEMLLAHDAALRARVEELEGLVAQEERAADVVNACRIESDARVERLEGLLREALPSHGATCLGACMDENDGYEPFKPSPNCYTVQLIERIRKALAGEE